MNTSVPATTGVHNVSGAMIVCRITAKIIRTVLFDVLRVVEEYSTGSKISDVNPFFQVSNSDLDSEHAKCTKICEVV